MSSSLLSFFHMKFDLLSQSKEGVNLDLVTLDTLGSTLMVAR